MLRIERVDRRSFFDGMTPGWMLGVVGYVLAILTLYFIPAPGGIDITPCLLRQSIGLPCPLCGGTTASVSLITGHPLVALAKNPAVAIGIPLVALWIVCRVGFGITLRSTLPKPLLVALVVAIVTANWAYVIHSRSSAEPSNPANVSGVKSSRFVAPESISVARPPFFSCIV